MTPKKSHFSHKIVKIEEQFLSIFLGTKIDLKK